jgi:hypothetical protein
MLNETLMLNKILAIAVLAMGLLACEGEESTAPAINCGAGTALNAAGDACEPTLSEGLSVNAAGEIVADTAGADTEATLAAAREEGRAEGVASVDITTDNQAAFDEGAASVDITTDNEAAREEGRAAGIASVTPLSCAEGTAENEAGDACEPTAEYRAATVEEGRAAGVASVTPLNCAEGTAENEAGDACEPNLSVDVAIDDEDTIVPTDAYAAQVCADGGGTFDAETGACAPTYDCFLDGIVGEEEPNNGPDEANDLGEITDAQTRIGGFILGADEDWYTFSVADRAQVTVRTESVQGNPMDTTITIFDADQVLIATNDDFEGLFSQVSVTFDGPATFFVQVASFAANTEPYNVVFEAVVAECAEEDRQTCGDEGILGCDGFFIELVQTCDFGCEEGQEGSACIIPEFVPETEPNDAPTLGVRRQIGGADIVDSFPFTMQGSIAEPGDDTDFYVVSSTNRGTFVFETRAFGENDVEDSKIAVCSLEQIFGPIGCTFGMAFDRGNNIVENDDNDIPGDFYSRVEVDLPAGHHFIMVQSFGRGTGDYLIDFDLVLPGEPNNTPDAAFPVSTDFSGDFAIEDADDLDFFTFDISQELLDEEGGDITLSFTLGPQDFPNARLLDSVMGLCQAPCLEDADQLANNDDGGPNGDYPGFYSQIIFNFDTPGSFILVVSGLNQNVGDFNLTIVNAGF